jgi:hypothetical protein
MKISDRDLIQLRKDIERVRKHEETRRARQASLGPAKLAPGQNLREQAAPQEPSIPLAVRLQAMFEALFVSTKSSKESLEAIPDHIVTLLEVIRDVPKFRQWFLAIGARPGHRRNEQLRKMSYALRTEDGRSAVADAYERLQDPNLFRAFCDALRGA